jgi:hypothetical protein
VIEMLWGVGVFGFSGNFFLWRSRQLKSELRPGTLASLATKDELQHDLGFVLSAQDMQKSMNSTHMDHMDISTTTDSTRA